MSDQTEAEKLAEKIRDEAPIPQVDRYDLHTYILPLLTDALARKDEDITQRVALQADLAAKDAELESERKMVTTLQSVNAIVGDRADAAEAHVVDLVQAYNQVYERELAAEAKLRDAARLLTRFVAWTSARHGDVNIRLAGDPTLCTNVRAFLASQEPEKEKASYKLVDVFVRAGDVDIRANDNLAPPSVTPERATVGCPICARCQHSPLDHYDGGYVCLEEGCNCQEFAYPPDPPAAPTCDCKHKDAARCADYGRTVAERCTCLCHGTCNLCGGFYSYTQKHTCPVPAPAAPPAETREFMRGVHAVKMIRCVKHRAVPQLNQTEHGGGECAACAAAPSVLQPGERTHRMLYEFVETLGKWPVRTNLAPESMFDVAKLARMLIERVDAPPAVPPEEQGWQQYRRTQIAEMHPWRSNFGMQGVSVSDVDRAAGSPKPGDMIARNPKNHNDQWLVAAAYFAENFEPMQPPAMPVEASAPPREGAITPENMGKVRRLCGWTQGDLAAKLGVSRGLVAQWETGATAISKRTALAFFAIIPPAPPVPPTAAPPEEEFVQHECDEVCEATGFGMHVLGELPGHETPGFKISILACKTHSRCIVIQGSEQHYVREVPATAEPEGGRAVAAIGAFIESVRETERIVDPPVEPQPEKHAFVGHQSDLYTCIVPGLCHGNCCGKPAADPCHATIEGERR